MWHSDLNLTTRRYTDEAGLASNVAVQKLSRFGIVREPVTQIVTQIFDFGGQILSQLVAGVTKKFTL